METEKEKHKYLPVLITVLIMLLFTASLVAGVWYYMRQQADNEKAELQRQIDELKSSINNKATEETANKTLTSNIFDVKSAKVGDKVGLFEIVSIRPFSCNTTSPISEGNVTVVFWGQATIDGSYDYSYSYFDGGYNLTFTPNADAYKTLPVIKGSENHQFPMRFSNQDKAMELLNITEGSPKKGNASITISGYTINRFPTETRDTLTIVSVE